MSATVSRVLVVGGGLSGASLAIGLCDHNIETTIVERDAIWGAKGTGITLMPPALLALHHLGVLDDCLVEGFGFSEMRIFTSAGDPIDTIPMAGPLGDDSPAVGGMMRPTLHRFLSERAVARGATVKLGIEVDSLVQDDDGVGVTLSDGSSETYDLVVGADGLHSKTRKMLLGASAPEPRPLALDVWRALVARPSEVSGLFQFYGAKHKTGFTPLTQDQMYCFLVQPNEDRSRPQPADRPATMRELLSDFGGVVADVRETIVGPEQVDVRQLETLIVPPPWHRGRAVLIGDAVHASTPSLAMGGATALEDGIVLAEVLSSGSDLHSALQAFSDRRFERCRMVVENSCQLSEWEKDAAAHAEDSAALIEQSMAALAQPT